MIINLDQTLALHKKWLRDEPDGIRADLSRANLRGVDLRWSDLSGANLSRADLSKANLIMANLRGANLSGADLSGANLSRADLRGANLRGADLSKADLFRANLEEANLSHIKGQDIFNFTLGKDQGVYLNGNVTIGCKSFTLDHWLANFKSIGTEARYTDKEIVRYGAMLNLIKNL